jgi:bifunctional DNase/RNase
MRQRRITTVGLLLLCGAGLLAASGRTETPAPRSEGPQEVEVVGLFVSRETEQPTVVLQGKRDKRVFAMVIGPAEATGIALPLQNVTPPRPLTHDLFLTLFGRLHVSVKKVVITDLRDHVYYATVHLAGSGGEMQLDSRPSDAIALAIRAKAPVYVEAQVFDKSERLTPASSPTAPRI